MPYVLGKFLVICILNWSKSYHVTTGGILQWILRTRLQPFNSTKMYQEVCANIKKIFSQLMRLQSLYKNLSLWKVVLSSFSKWHFLPSLSASCTPIHFPGTLCCQKWLPETVTRCEYWSARKCWIQLHILTWERDKDLSTWCMARLTLTAKGCWT